MANTVQSRKSKGRRLQQHVRDRLVQELGIHPDDVESRSMGASGEDLIMAKAARDRFPYSIECKNVQALNIWKAYEQAAANSGNYQPVVIFKKNHKNPLIAIDFEAFLELVKKANSVNFIDR